MKIIGLSGKSGSGKDFIGREILRPLGYRQWALAWPMKNEAVGANFSYEDVHVNKPQVVREFLQRRGTEEGWKLHGREYWCKIAGAWLRTIEEQWGVDKFYISDVRFPHEVDWIHSLGGKVVRLQGRGGLDGDAAFHESEIALDHYDFEAFLYNPLGTTFPSLHSQLYRAGIIEEATTIVGRRHHGT